MDTILSKLVKKKTVLRLSKKTDYAIILLTHYKLVFFQSLSNILVDLRILILITQQLQWVESGNCAFLNPTFSTFHKEKRYAID